MGYAKPNQTPTEHTFSIFESLAVSAKTIESLIRGFGKFIIQIFGLVNSFREGLGRHRFNLSMAIQPNLFYPGLSYTRNFCKYLEIFL